MDRYQRQEKPKAETSSNPIEENEIRVTTQGLIRNYLTYATSLLQDKGAKEIVLKAMGQAISKTVAISEIIKKSVPELHQDIAISSVSITDVWEPIEDGLLPVETTRQVSMISITLSTKELNKNSTGYQAPTNVGLLKKPYYSQQQQRQPWQARGPYNTVIEDSYGQGRGRSRGRGRGQNWGRGRYGSYDSYQDNDGYSNWGGRSGGRGRSWGGYRENGYEGGTGGYERGPGGYGRGRGGYERGYGGYERGRGGYNRGPRGYDRGPGGYNGGSNEYERGGYERGGFERGRSGYEGGRGGGRGYGRGRGRMGGRSRGGPNEA